LIIKLIDAIYIYIQVHRLSRFYRRTKRKVFSHKCKGDVGNLRLTTLKCDLLNKELSWVWRLK